MSDEEEVYEAEEEVEAEAEPEAEPEAAEEPEPEPEPQPEEEEAEPEPEPEEEEPEPEPEPEPVVRKPPPRREVEMEEDSGVNEAQAALRKKREQMMETGDEELQEYMDKRREIAEALEAEIEELKEKIAEGKIIRAEEEAEMRERQRVVEERMKQEQEDRIAKIAEEKAKRDIMKKKGGQNFHVPKKPNGKNFVIEKKSEEEKATPQAAGKVGPSKEELAARKKEVLSNLCRPLNIDGLGTDDLKKKIKTMHEQICKLEADRYDLEKRQERQEYDMRELGEREKQQARQKALKKGLDPVEAANSPHPPKVQVQSKYDRQIDRRSYGERHTLFAKPEPEKKFKVFHGSCRAPADWGRKETEEMEMIRKNMEPRKYQEQVTVEGPDAKPPCPIVPASCPEPGSMDVVAEEGEAPAAAAPAETAK